MSDKVTCPLDPVHVVERHKLVYHLSRCIRTYRGGQHTTVHCPLDYSHVVEAGQIDAHVRQCPQLVALAGPLFNVSSDQGGAVTGNLRLPEQPSCIDQLVTAEWDTPDDSADAAAAAAGTASDTASTTTAASAAAFGVGRGRGRGRVAGASGVGGVGGGTNNEDEDEEGLRPGQVTPGGYVIKDLPYPPGYGPRGRHEQRGMV